VQVHLTESLNKSVQCAAENIGTLICLVTSEHNVHHFQLVISLLYWQYP